MIELTRAVKHKLALQVAERLQGTCCTTIEQEFSDIGLPELAFDQQVLEDIDGEVLLCSACDWWAEADDGSFNTSDEFVCSDCGG